MRRTTFIVIVFMLETLATGRTFVLTKGDPNTCVQSDYRLVCPLTVDPNLLNIGPMMPPPNYDPNDPNSPAGWSIPHGKFNWELNPCDPDDDPMFVDVIATNTIGAGIIVDAAGRVWLACEVPLGVAWWHLRVTDAPTGSEPLSRDVIAAVNVLPRPNRPPVLNPMPN